MSLTPGQLLRAELDRRKSLDRRDRDRLSQADFARLVQKTPATIQNWFKDRGFGDEQRALAAEVLGLQRNHFDRPSFVQQREEKRLESLAEFRQLPIAHDITDDEMKCLDSIRWPPFIAPSSTLYVGVFVLIRKLMTLTELEQSLPSITQGIEQFLLRKRAHGTQKTGVKAAAKKPRKRRKPRAPHK